MLWYRYRIVVLLQNVHKHLRARKKKLFTFQKLHGLIHARDSHMCFAYVQNGICFGCLGQMLTTHAHFDVCTVCKHKFGAFYFRLHWLWIVKVEIGMVSHRACNAPCVCCYPFVSFTRCLHDGVLCMYSRVDKSESKLVIRFWCGSNFLTVYPSTQYKCACVACVYASNCRSWEAPKSVCKFITQAHSHIHAYRDRGAYRCTGTLNIRLDISSEISFDNCLYSFVSFVCSVCLGGCAPCSMCCFMNNYSWIGQSDNNDEKEKNEKEEE